MPTATACLPPNLIDQYLDDQLPETEAIGFETHLATCPECEDRLREAIRNDSLLRLARPQGSQRVACDRTPGPLRDKLLELHTEPEATRPLDGNSAQGNFSIAQSPDLAGVLHPAQAPDEIGRLGGYRVLRILGRGGMGVVCLGEDQHLRRPVAIKVIRPGAATDPRAEALFLREARAMAALAHEHIVTIFQGGSDGGTLFLVMEFLEGQTVADWMEKNPRRRFGDVLRIAREAAEGLAYAHSKGVIHRDIKPGNLWRTSDRSRTKLLDFGLARDPNGDTLTNPGDRYGTPAYMAPEQATGRETDHRADLFSLGVVLYQLATGVSPFSRSRANLMLMAVTSHTPEPLDRSHPWLPVEFVRLAGRLLAKDPADRIGSADEAVAELRRVEEIATQSDLLERLVGTPDTTPKPRTSRRFAWVAMLAFGLVVAVGLGQFIMRITKEDGKKVDVLVDAKGRIAATADGKAQSVVIGPDDKVELVPISPPIEVKAGDPISSRALTRKPKQFRDASIKSWTLETIRQRGLVDPFRGVSVAFQPGGTYFATAGSDSTIRVYDSKNWQFVKAIVPPIPARQISWTPDGKHLITLPLDTSTDLGDPLGDRAFVWDVESARVVRALSSTPVGWTAVAAYSADGTRLALTTMHRQGGSEVLKRAVHVVNLRQAGEPVELFAGKGTNPVTTSWNPPTSPHGESNLLTVGYHGERGGEIRIWDVTTQKVVRNFQAGFEGISVGQLSWSPDGKKLAVGSDDGLAVWFSEKRVGLGSGPGNARFAWSPTGDALAAPGPMGLRIFDTTNADGKFKDIRTERTMFRILSWSLDGKLLAYLTGTLTPSGANIASPEIRFIDRDGKESHVLPTAERLAYNAEEGWFREPKDGKPAFVFVVQTDKGQETLTPEEFAKRTGWKNEPNKVFVLGE